MTRRRLSLYALCIVIAMLVLLIPSESQAQMTAAQARALPWFASLPAGWHASPCPSGAASCVEGPDGAQVIAMERRDYRDTTRRFLDALPGAVVQDPAIVNSHTVGKGSGDRYSYTTEFKRQPDGTLSEFVVARHDRNQSLVFYMYVAPEPVFRQNQAEAVAIIVDSTNRKMETVARLEEQEPVSGLAALRAIAASVRRGTPYSAIVNKMGFEGRESGRFDSFSSREWQVDDGMLWCTFFNDGVAGWVTDKCYVSVR